MGACYRFDKTHNFGLLSCFLPLLLIWVIISSKKEVCLHLTAKSTSTTPILQASLTNSDTKTNLNIKLLPKKTTIWDFFNWDSLHTWLNSHYKMELQEEAQKDYKRYRESLQKEPTVNICLLILDLKPFRS